MARKSAGFTLGIVFFCIHLGCALLAYAAYTNSHSSTAGLVFVPFFVLDAPLHLLMLLFPESLFTFGTLSPLIMHGVFGSSLWFVIPWLMDRLVARLFTRSRKVRCLIVLISLPLLLAGFVPLNNLVMKTRMRRERPVELEASLSAPPSEFFSQRVVYDDDHLGGVTSINRGNYRPNAGIEVLLACHRGVAFMDDGYVEQRRIEFSGRFFMTVQPTHVNGSQACQFIAYKLFKHAMLLNTDGEELWRTPETAGDGLHIDGVQMGDIDGDGKPEFAVYHRYREGIALVDANGETLWTHPVHALGHLEMTDIRRNGKEEIIYSNSNNASHLTTFKTLDARGTVAAQLVVSTDSYEFAAVAWPGNQDGPNLLLTEENRIRIVDTAGNDIVELDAPGCRPFGKVKAVTVKFQQDSAPCLAVRKILHPDLAVLFVYDADGHLVFHRAEVRKGTMQPALAAIPVAHNGTEKLLVGAMEGDRVKVLEFSLTQQVGSVDPR